MFSAGHPNACFAVAEAFQVGGHDIIFLRRESNKTWWDDVKKLEESSPKCIHIDDAKDIELVVEIGYLLTPLERSKFPKSVWYCRKPALFNDIEASIFACRVEGRDLEGISEIWVADIFNNSDDVTYLRTLYPSIPISLVPWLWSPTIVEAHRKQVDSPVWTQVKDHIPADTKWSLHITETNASNTSSCTLPIIMIESLKNMNKVEKIHVHNSENIEKSNFFLDNILKNCRIKDKKLVGRQRIIEWSSEPNSVILSHSRFVKFKLANLEAVWVGIPLVHNNSVLKELGCGLEKVYYEQNNILDAVNILDKLIESPKAITYLQDVERLNELRGKIIQRFSPEARAQEWLELLNVKKVNRKYFILFTDMWDQFNEAHNMFTLAFSKELQGLDIVGYSPNTLPLGVVPDIHIFGPFGSVW
jgi:hypothetical protein